MLTLISLIRVLSSGAAHTAEQDLNLALLEQEFANRAGVMQKLLAPLAGGLCMRGGSAQKVFSEVSKELGPHSESVLASLQALETNLSAKMHGDGNQYLSFSEVKEGVEERRKQIALAERKMAAAKEFQ